MKWLKRIGIVLVALLLVLATAAWWLLGTAPGLRFALARAQSASHGALQWRQAQGALIGPLRIDGLRYDDGQGMRLDVAHARLDLRCWPLLTGRLQLRTLDLDDVRVTLPASTRNDTPSQPVSLKPPIDLQLDQARIIGLHIAQANQPLFAADRITLAGRWTPAGLVIDRLALRAPDGRVDLDGRLALARRQRGQAKADFDWAANGQRYAGQLNARSDGKQAQLDLTLRQPMLATLQLQLAQTRHADWQVALHVPSFDPVPLLGASAPSPMALQLRGHGAGLGGELTGRIDLGTHTLQLQPLRAQLDLDRHTLTARQFALRLPPTAGRLDASGSLQWQAGLAWQLAVQTTHFDPGEIFPGWNGALALDLASHGKLIDQHMDATLTIKQLAGQLRDRPLRGSGALHLSPAMTLAGELNLASGASTLELHARPGRGNDADLRLAIASLGDWLPGASGRLDGQFNLRGNPPWLAINGHAEGSALSWQQQHMQTLRLIVGIPDTRRPAGKLALDLTGAKLGGMDFSRLHLLAEGSERTHQLTLDARGSQLSAQLAVRGSWQNNAWNGTLSTLSIAPQGLPPWRLRQPSRLGWRNDTFSLSDTCLDAGDPQLCLSGKRDRSGNLEAVYRLRELPLALVQDASGMSDLPVRVDGHLDGEGSLRRSASGVFNGTASLRSAQGSLNWIERDDLPPLGYRQLVLDATLGAKQQRFNLHTSIDQGGALDGQLTLSGKTQALAGQVALHLPHLAYLEAFTHALANVHGEADAHLRIGGTLAQPTLDGSAALTRFAAEAPAAGIKLTDGQLSASTDAAHNLQLTGSVRSGAGTLAVTGVIGLGDAATTQLTLRGDKLTAADIPAAKLIVTPDLQLVHDAQGLDLTGTLTLDSANVDLDKLPGGGSAKASPDVVVVDRAPRIAAASLPIRARVAVDLGSATHVSGQGIDARLAGLLTVDQRPGQAATGQGQVTLNGSYKAYGQTLAIEQGKLLFAGSPLDNPGLSMRAVRKLSPNATIDDGQQVGLQITGTARRPVLTVFSNPPMEQSDALAYLITGKPLSQVNSGEGDMLNSAAQALGSAAGNYLAKTIGSHLGLDDIGVSSNAALGGSSAFTVGKYLSPRLYLSYGVGLFEPGEVVTLRYRLSHRWNVEAQSATSFNRASFNYRLEK